MKTKLNILLYISIAILLSACYPTRRIGLIQERNGIPSYEQGEVQQYKLQPNDELELRVISFDPEITGMFQTRNTSSNYSFPYKIYEDGTIDLPFLSKIPVAGLTVKEAEALISEKLKSFGPDITVKLALATNTFCVIGDAGRGYFKMYKDRLTIFQALALCGGINESADYSKVKILRRNGEDTKIVEFDIRSKSILDSEYYYIYPNDIIYIDVSKRRFWAIDSYSGFLSVITASIALLVSVWTTLQ